MILIKELESVTNVIYHNHMKNSFNHLNCIKFVDVFRQVYAETRQAMRI